MNKQPEEEKKKKSLKAKALTSIKFACVGVAAIGIALASGTILSTVFNPDIMHLNPARVGNAIGDKFLSFAFMFEDVFDKKEHNFALVSVIGGMQVTGALIMGKTVFDVLDSTIGKIKSKIFPSEKEKKQLEKAKAMEKLMLEAMAEQKLRTENQASPKSNIKEESHSDKNDNFVDGLLEKKEPQVNNPNIVLDKIADFKKTREDQLKSSSKPIHGP